MKKSISYLFIIVFLAIYTINLSPIAKAEFNELIKCPDFSAVYYKTSDNKRMVFPNEKVYSSWYEDFSKVETITCSELASISIQGLATYQPGTKMIKTTSDPTVYVVEPFSIIRPIQSEQQAKDLFGSNWNQRIHDISDAYFGSYTFKSPLELNTYPNGSIVKSNLNYFYIYNLQAKQIPTNLINTIQKESALSDIYFSNIKELTAFTEQEWKEFNNVQTQKISTYFNMSENFKEQLEAENKLETPILQDPGLTILSDQEYIIEWNEIEEANYYILQESTSVFFNEITEYETQKTSISFKKNANERKNYYYRVQAKNSEKLSNYSSFQDIVIVPFDYIAGLPDTLQTQTDILSTTDLSNWSIPTAASQIIHYHASILNNIFAKNVDANLTVQDVSAYIGWFMDTNNQGSNSRLNIGQKGTLNNDIINGLTEFLQWDGKDPSIFGFDVPQNLDTKIGYNGWDIIPYNLEQQITNTAWEKVKDDVDNFNPILAVFKYWNPVDLQVKNNQIEFYKHGPEIANTNILNPGTQNRPPSENYQNQIGHGSVIIGYIENFSVKDINFKNWVIVLDNWQTTPELIAVPFENLYSIYSIEPGIANPPQEITNLQGPNSVMTGQEFYINWQISTDASQYRIEYSTDSNFNNNVTVLTTSLGNPNEQKLQIDIPGTYYFRVKSQSPFGNSDWVEGLSINIIQS